MEFTIGRVLLAAAALLVATGCGEPPYATIVSFDVTPRTLPPGGGEVELSWETRNATGIVVQPGNHSALPARGTLRKVITESTEFTLRLSGQVRDFTSNENVKTMRVEVETLEISGTVIDGAGAPAPNFEVSINGGEPVVTDGNGRFMIAGVTPPYALRVHDPVPTSRRNDQLWLDLVDLHPTVFAGGTYSSPTNKFFDVNVAWTGGGVTEVPLGALPVTHLFVLSREVSSQTLVDSGESSGQASLTLAFPDEPSGPIKVFVLQGYMQDVVEAPWVRTIFHYQRLGHTEVYGAITQWPLNAGTVALVPATTTTVDVEVEAGAWLKHSVGAFNLLLPGFAPLRLWGDGSSARSYQLTAPPIPGATFSFNGTADGEGPPGEPDPRIRFGGVAWDGSGPLRLQFDAPPVAVEPTRYTPFADRFVFTRELPGPCRVMLSEESSGAVEIHSERRELTAAFLSSLGVDVDERGYWDAECPSGFSSLGEALGDLARYRAALRAEPGQMLGHFGPIFY